MAGGLTRGNAACLVMFHLGPRVERASRRRSPAVRGQNGPIGVVAAGESAPTGRKVTSYVLAASILQIPRKESRHALQRVVASSRSRSCNRYNASARAIRRQRVHRVVGPVKIVIGVRVYLHLDL